MCLSGVNLGILKETRNPSEFGFNPVELGLEVREPFFEISSVGLGLGLGLGLGS